MNLKLTIQIKFRNYNYTCPSQQLMSTIRAKQQICLNIASIRCLSTYTSGRYCLRFSIYETSNNVNNQTNQSQLAGQSHHHISKYATPVSVIEYRKNVLKNNNYNHPNYGPPEKPIAHYDISEHIYTTKPFLLKPNSQVPIYQLAVFKHDINIFSSRYQNDFHDVLLKVSCQLVQFDYTTGQNGRVISIFDGRIRGAGINDAILIDFLEGVTGCQVVGSVHSCVYQFQYVYTGGPVFYPLNSLNVNSRASQNKGKIQKQKRLEKYEDKKGNKFRRKGQSQYDRNIIKQDKNDKNNVIITNMTFQLYCNMQTSQYVQSLLQYLLKQIKKSEEKVDINLQVFQFDNPHTNAQKAASNREKDAQDKELMESLTKSLFNQKQMQKCEQNNKERLSLIKSELIKEEIQQEDLIVFEEDQCEQKKNMDRPRQNYLFKNNHDDVEHFENSQDEQRVDYKEKKIILKQQQYHFQTEKKNMKEHPRKELNFQEEEDDLIYLQQQIYNIYPTHPKTSDINFVKSYTHNDNDNEGLFIKLEVDQDQQSREINKINNNNNNNNNYNYKIQTTSADQLPSRIVSKQNKRRKIFVHTQKNITNILHKNNQKIPKADKNLYEPDLQMSIQSSINESRQIPINTIHHHPNSFANSKNLRTHEETSKKITIEEFERILHTNSLSIYQKWRKFLNHLTGPQGLLLVTAYSTQYRKKLVSLLGQSVIKFKGSWQFDIYSKEEGLRNKMAYQIRNQVEEHQKNIKVNQFRFYDKLLFDKNKPILFEQMFEKFREKQNPVVEKNKKSFIKVSLSSQNQHSSEKTHIIFLVHGLGACRVDMEKLKIQIKRSFAQKVSIITSSSNQGRTQGDIALMGVRFAHEVSGQLSKHLDNSDNIDGENIKISFIGHSMGGIIIRSALPKLEKYKKLFHSFVTLSSPHVGYNYASSKLIDVGLWLINNWKKCQSILQLTMSETTNSGGSKNAMEDTFLYKLSLQKGLEWFKKITFLASRQDLYVPYFSARVQKPEQIINDIKSNNQYAKTHSKMVDNMLSRITGTVSRIDVNFCITQQNIDNLIGRAAHICFVNNEQFLRLLCLADQSTLI